MILALGQVVFAYNLIHTLRGHERRAGEGALRSIGLTASLLVASALLAGTALALNNENAGEQPAKPGLGAAGGATAAGAKLFSENCGACHTLAAADAQGTVGPNFDETKPDAAAVLAAIKNGGAGSGTMPKDLLLGKDAQAVADFIEQSSGK